MSELIDALSRHLSDFSSLEKRVEALEKMPPVDDKDLPPVDSKPDSDLFLNLSDEKILFDGRPSGDLEYDLGDYRFAKNSSGGTYGYETIDGVLCFKLSILDIAENRYRSEISHREEARRRAYRHKIGSSMRFEVRYFIPEEWRSDEKGKVIWFQTHGSPDDGEIYRGPPFSVQYMNGLLQVRQRYSSEQVNLTNPRGEWIYEGPMVFGWVTLRFETKFSYSDDGWLRLYLNDRLLVSQDNHPNSFNDLEGHFAKAGQYRPFAKNGTFRDPKNTSIYVSRYRISHI